MTRYLLVLCLLLAAPGATSAGVRVLAATNVHPCLEQIARQFTAATDIRVEVRQGATGVLCAQLLAGAPGDVFFAADTLRPRMLEAKGLTVPGSRFTYAVGRLVLWYPDNTADDLSTAVDQAKGTHLAISNPVHAPYGIAAVQALQTLGHWDRWQDRVVRGANVGQTWQFIHSGAAVLGFVSLAQVRYAQTRGAVFGPAEVLLVPANLHEPITQQAVLMRKASPAAAPFLAYVRSPEAHAILREFGYEVPTP